LNCEPKVCKVFAKNNRLRNAEQFAFMKNNGCKAVGKLMVLSFVKDDVEVRKFAVITSRKYDKLAVCRNRTRRLFREAYRRLLPEMNYPIWLVMIPRWKIKNAKMQDVYQEMRMLLVKNKIINKAYK